MTCTLPGQPATKVSVSVDQVDENGNIIPDTPAMQTTPSTTMPTTYFFDATLRVEHVQEAVGTKHPVQVGPAVVDHIYLLPARVTLDVAISDSMQSFASGQYTGAGSRSISAYQTFKQIQAARVPIALSTRLANYSNMWLADVRGVEDSTSSRSFRGTLRFEQIISAQVSTATVSALPNTTDTTNEGTKGVESAPTDLINQIPLSH
jgi:hypothetical protein